MRVQDLAADSGRPFSNVREWDDEPALLVEGDFTDGGAYLFMLDADGGQLIIKPHEQNPAKRYRLNRTFRDQGSARQFIKELGEPRQILHFELVGFEPDEEQASRKGAKKEG